MSSQEGSGLFAKSRLRSYGGKLAKSIDASLALSSAVALSPGALQGPVAALVSDGDCAGELAAQLASPTRKQAGIVAAHTASTEWQTGSTDSISSDIQLLKSEMAGLQCVLAYLSGAESGVVSTMGKTKTRPLAQSQLRERAAATLRASGYSPVQRPDSALPPIGPDQGDAANTEHATRHGSLPQSPSRPQQTGSASRRHTVDVLSPSPSQQYTASSCASQLGFEALSSWTQPQGGLAGGSHNSARPVGWRRPAPVAPVGRGEAVILEAALDEALPSGAITAKYKAAAEQTAAVAERMQACAALVNQTRLSDGCASQSMSFEQCKNAMPALSPEQRAGLEPPTPARVLLESQDIRKDHELLDGVLREAARQVTSHCAERGRVMIKIAERYQEVFASLAAMVGAVHVTNTALVAQLEAERAVGRQQAERIAALEAELQSKQAVIDQQDFEYKALAAELEHTRWDLQQEVAGLKEQNQILADQVEALTAALEEEVAGREEALERGFASLEAQLAALSDQRDDLLARIRFLEKQLVAHRMNASKVPETSNSCIQTDTVGAVEETDMDMISDLEPDPNSSPVTFMSGVMSMRVRKKPRSNRILGGFDGMILSDRPGRIRGLQWTVATICALYADKILADAVADRDTRPRAKICDFTFEWHLNKYGLRTLAEVNLVDLIASVRHHAKNVPRVRWFAQFTGPADMGRDAVPDTTPHLSFYLFLLQQLAFPNAIQCLFPDTDQIQQQRISTTAMPEVCKAVFRYLNDPESASLFMNHVEAMAVADHQDNAPNTVLLEPLMRSFMSEYAERYNISSQHLKALFLAGDSDRDGLINYDTFTALVDMAAPDATERLKAAMYGECIRSLPAGQHLIPLNTWLTVTQTFGFDRWKIDPNSPSSPLMFLSQQATPGQLLSQGPGVLGLLHGQQRTSQSGSARNVPLASRAMRHTSDTSNTSLSSAPSMRRLNSTRSVDKSIWQALKTTLQDMQPGLPDLVTAAISSLPRSSSTLTLIRQQASHLSHILTHLPQAKPFTDILDIAAALAPPEAPPPAAPAADAPGTSAVSSPTPTAKGGRNGGGKGDPSRSPSPNRRRNGGTNNTRPSGVIPPGSGTNTATTGKTMGASTGPVSTSGAGGGNVGWSANGTFVNGASIGVSGIVGGLVDGAGVSAASVPTPDAAQAWCAFHLLYVTVAAALSPTRPAARGAASSGGGAGSRPGSAGGASPPRRRMVVQPAMPWRNGRVDSGYPTATPNPHPMQPPTNSSLPVIPAPQQIKAAVSSRLRASTIPLSSDMSRSGSLGMQVQSSSGVPDTQAAQAAIENASSLTAAMQAMQAYKITLEETYSQASLASPSAATAAAAAGVAGSADGDTVGLPSLAAAAAAPAAAQPGLSEEHSTLLGIEASHAWKDMSVQHVGDGTSVAPQNTGGVPTEASQEASFEGFPQMS